jgi:hypothetical protein
MQHGDILETLPGLVYVHSLHAPIIPNEILVRSMANPSAKNTSDQFITTQFQHLFQ